MEMKSKKKVELKKLKVKKKITEKMKIQKPAKKPKVLKVLAKKQKDTNTSHKKSEGDIFEGAHKAKIRIIGIGGGGGSIVSSIALKIKKADFLVANTDAMALKILNNNVKKFQFGENLTKGLGTGMNVEMGEMAANEDKEKIKKIFEGQDLCIIVSCLGGGTAAGATPVFAKIAKNSGCLTYGIFTLPFNFEGEKKAEIAKQALQRVKPYFNIFSLIPNERIFQIIDKNTPLQNALSAINNRLVDNLDGLLQMIYSVGLINIDFADLKTILAGYGKLSYLNTVEIDESHKEEAARKVASTPLYPYNFKGAKGILYNLVGGKNLCLSDVHKISSIISESVNRNAKIIFGINQNMSNSDKLKITLLAVGCGGKPEFMGVKEEEDEDEKKLIAQKEIKRKKMIRQKPKIQKKPSNIKPSVKKKEKKETAKNKNEPVRKAQTIPVVVQEAAVSAEGNAAGEESVKLMADVKIRRSALEVKKVVEEEEKELLERENIWETPAILRRKDK